MHTYLGDLVPVLSVRAHAPGHGCDSDDNTNHDGGVCAPVLGLGVPTTGRGPDVLRVPVVAMSSAIGIPCALRNSCYTYGTLAPPPISACVGFIVVVSCAVLAPGAANHLAVLVEVRLEGEVRATEVLAGCGLAHSLCRVHSFAAGDFPKLRSA